MCEDRERKKEERERERERESRVKLPGVGRVEKERVKYDIV